MVIANENSSPRDMLQDLLTEVVENTSLLEVIFRNYEMEPEADNAIQCLIRSQLKTIEKANNFIGMVSDPPPLNGYGAT